VSDKSCAAAVKLPERATASNANNAAELGSNRLFIYSISSYLYAYLSVFRAKVSWYF
jgi:hypothetical protein